MLENSIATWLLVIVLILLVLTILYYIYVKYKRIMGAYALPLYSTNTNTVKNDNSGGKCSCGDTYNGQYYYIPDTGKCTTDNDVEEMLTIEAFKPPKIKSEGFIKWNVILEEKTDEIDPNKILEYSRRVNL